ncbi:hypothetical protein KBD08_03325 [Candidatus Babeliales bacterium]|nr:hypothetical protein [Candidatus Babeliales bacterium]
MLTKTFFALSLLLTILLSNNLECAHYRLPCSDNGHERIERWTERSSQVLNGANSIKENIDFLRLPEHYASAAREHEQAIPALEEQKRALIAQQKVLRAALVSFKRQQEELEIKTSNAVNLLLSLNS